MVAANLMHSMDPERYQFSLVCFEGTNGIIPRIDRTLADVEVIEKRPGADPGQVLRLARYLRSIRPGLVHTFNPEALIFGWPAAQAARVPALVHAYHGLTGEQEPGLFNRVHRYMMRRSDHVVVVSEALEELVRQDFGIPRDKVTVIVNGVDLTPFDVEFDRESFRRDLGLGPSDWAVCTVGKLSPRKNQQLLIRAAARVEGVHVFIVGGGPSENELRELVEDLGVQDRVFLVGERSDIPSFLRAMDLFCLTSTAEGTSLAILEAMAASLPVLVTDVGGNGELVKEGETGFLTPSNELEPFAERLAWTLHHRDRCRALGAGGRCRVESTFGFSTTVAAYDSVFQAALGKNRARGGGAS